MRILLVAGARPNFVKLAPLWRALREYPDTFEPLIVHTGQHYDHRLSQIFFDELELPTPDISLGVGSGSHAQQTAGVMAAFEPVLKETSPDWVVVFGDVNSTVAAAMTAAKEQIPIAHVEAGLRSFDRSMPEELNRLVTDHLADLLFTSCADADANLANEGISKAGVHFVGNIMIDSLERALPEANSRPVLTMLGIEAKSYALVTLHRPANVDDPLILQHNLEILNSIATRLPVVFPVHPRTRQRLAAVGAGVWRNQNIKLIEPLGYLDFLKLEQDAAVVLTDSGGIQEETTVLNVPCLTMRQNTERPVTITHGTNRLVGSDRKAILAAVSEILDAPAAAAKRPPLWDGKTAERICRVFQGMEERESAALECVAAEQSEESYVS